MTDKQILKKAIEKAVKNGYIFDYTKKYWSESLWHKLQFQGYYERFIFNHGFAKAFFGDGFNKITVVPEQYDYYHTDCHLIDKDWKFHLQQLVLEEDPIKYLEKFLEKKGIKK